MSVTIKDVAKRACTSATTVSRYLNKIPGSMSKETEKRVAAAIEELDYTPNMIARSMNKKRSIETIGVIVADIINPYSTQIIRGIEDICKTKNFNIILCNTDDDPQKQQEYLDMLVSKQVDGIIIQPIKGGLEKLRQIKEKIPIVILDRQFKELDCLDTVLVDNRMGAKSINDYLINLNHTNIGLITPPYDFVSSRYHRVEGYKDAISSANLEVGEDKIFIINSKEEEMVEEELAEIIKGIKEKTNITALFTINAKVTLEVLIVLDKLNIHIPGDLSLVGFDNPQWSRLIKPKLTVLEQPTYQIGVESAKLLLDRISAKEKNIIPKFIKLKTKLIKGESCRGIKLDQTF